MGGGVLALYGLARRNASGLVLASAGVGLAARVGEPLRHVVDRPPVAAPLLGHELGGERVEVGLGDELLERPAFEVLHRDELGRAGNAQIEDTDDIPMRDLAGKDQLSLESLQDFRIPGQIGTDHL